MAGKVLLLIFAVLSEVFALKLNQVVILGRHNVRAPFYTSQMETYTPKIWPTWKEEASYLTEKGYLLETYMGEYFSSWFKERNWFEECPSTNSVYIYTNTRHRTIETGLAFASTAFKDCNVTVFYRGDVTVDPIFHPVILNTTEAFKSIVFEEMQARLNALHLDKEYKILNEILDLNNSRLCKETQFCDLTNEKDKILFKYAEEPDINGPLSVANSVVDVFLMAFYNGVPFKKIAWGALKPGALKTLTKITKEDQYVRFYHENLAKHVAKPLLNLIYDEFVDEKHDFTLLVGHDSNINSILAAIGFQPYTLPNQHELTPVGSKLAFQKWYNETDNTFLLKVEYIYQTTDQLRSGKRLSVDEPPGTVTLQLTNCKTDGNGYCPWQDFLDILEELQ